MQSAANLLISILAGGKHTEIKVGAAPYDSNLQRSAKLKIVGFVGWGIYCTAALVKGGGLCYY